MEYGEGDGMSFSCLHYVIFDTILLSDFFPLLLLALKNKMPGIPQPQGTEGFQQPDEGGSRLFLGRASR